MSYLALPQILARLGRQGNLDDTPNSFPTLTQAGEMQAGVSAEIDMAIAPHVASTPVASPSGLVTYLGAVEAWGTAAEILKAKFQSGGGPDAEKAWAFFEGRYQKALTRLAEGAGVDSSAGDQLLPESYYTRNPDIHEEIGDIAEPVFADGMAF
jgi:hypothetical protein